MRRPLSEQVVVITGASSGIGRETARLLASRGARVVVAARNEQGLEETVRQMREAGGDARHVVADVSDWDQVRRIGEEAVNAFGRVDSWVNNAGISLYAAFEEVEPDEMRRVVEVNLLGQMYGSKVALDLMKERGEGNIINVSSVLARSSVPMQSAYCAAKHGITGFTESLRVELKRSYPGIDAVEVMPSSINTPLFGHARSKLGVHPMPIPPIYEPAVVAEVIAYACENGGREYFPGGSGKLFTIMRRLNPMLLEAYLRQGDRGVKTQRTDWPDDNTDNLFAPMEEHGSARGRWSDEAHEQSTFTRALEMHPERKAALGLLALGGTILALTRARR